MYAVLRQNSFDPDKLAASRETLEEFDRAHGSQPGFVGTVVVDLGQGRRFMLNLWESEKHAAEGLSALIPQVERLVNPLLSRPSEFGGAGTVIFADPIPSYRT